ncbi:solute carrier family 23 member 3 [Scyliorhinus canicula]|uniref:solute carrier family 23 member 3 n=1 Tax=Scyliorhinus canicula TaxID=7830 RepID=UPI0018F30D29|nr:solute carrier family 23 member 3 [Scyliorhinus canicula]
MERKQSTEQGPKRKAEMARYPFHRRPPWILSSLFAVQHLLVQAALIQTVHCLLIDALPSDQGTRQHGYQFMATSLFASGISTLLQTSLGCRLPIMQAPSFEYLIPAAILASSPMETNSSHYNGTEMAVPCEGALCTETDIFLQTWKHTLSEIRGAVLVSGLLQVFLGLTGLQGLTSRHCGPMVLAPMLSIIGLSCYKEAAHFSSSHWGVTALLILLVVILSQHLRSCYIPIWSWKKSKGFDLLTYFPLFRIFSLLLPVTVLWILCGVLPEGDPLSPYPGGGHRGILRSNGTRLVPWFNIPKPGEWGAPSINIQSTCIGIIMALGTSISSLGCYVMCSKVMGCLHPPRDSCNRGICLEGVGSCIAALLGGITSTSSSIPNVGALALTQAESRHSVQIAAMLCILVGMSAKLTYFLTTIPAAIHGGVLSVTNTMAVSVGVSYFQYTNIDSGRNIFIIGFTMFMALLTPHWFIRNTDYIVTGVRSLDIFLLALLMMPIIQGGFIAFLLDNTVSGTSEERGLVAHFPGFQSRLEGHHRHPPKDLTDVYQLPSTLHKYLCIKFFPFCNLCPSSEPVQEPMAEGEETRDLLPTPELVASGGEIGVANTPQDCPGVCRD